MTQKPTSHPDSLTALQRGYTEHLRLLLAEIVQLKNTMAKARPQPDNLQRLHTLIHNLCGSGTTFGFPAISQTGHELVGKLKPCMEAEPERVAALLQEPGLLALLDGFERACNAAILSETQLSEQASACAAAISSAVAAARNSASSCRIATSPTPAISWNPCACSSRG